MYYVKWEQKVAVFFKIGIQQQQQQLCYSFRMLIQLSGSNKISILENRPFSHLFVHLSSYLQVNIYNMKLNEIFNLLDTVLYQTTMHFVHQQLLLLNSPQFKMKQFQR